LILSLHPSWVARSTVEQLTCGSTGASTAMSRTAALLAAAMCLVVAASGVAAAPVNKCVVNGTATYQREPCPSGQVRNAPTVQELNAAQKKKREAAAAAALDKPAPAAPGPDAGADRPVPASTGGRTTATGATEPATARPGSFRCDGRTHCSQMTSCAEARYFLAQCPGVKMDGDRNGVPCEKQWCGR